MKSRKENVRSDTITAITSADKNLFEVNEERPLQWVVHPKRVPGNRLIKRMLKWEPEGTRRNGRSKDG